MANKVKVDLGNNSYNITMIGDFKDSVKRFSREIQAQRFIEVLEIVIDGKGQNVANLLPDSGLKI